MNKTMATGMFIVLLSIFCLLGAPHSEFTGFFGATSLLFLLGGGLFFIIGLTRE